MRKQLFFVLLMIASVIPVSLAQESFTTALRTCEKYSQLGGVALGVEYYNILITLDKNKKKCNYKEKIYQSSGYQMLSCNFEMDQLSIIADSMERFNNVYKKEIEKNKIYEAKLTNNYEIFEKFLINPKYCQITKSKTK